MDTRSEQTPAPVRAAILLLAVPPFFTSTFFQSGLLRYGSFALALLILLFYSGCRNFRITVSKPLSLMVLLFLLSFFNQNSSLETGSGFQWFFGFGLCLVAAILLSSFPTANWGISFLRIVEVLGAFYAAMTIIIWLVPSLYDDFIYPVFFSDFVTIVGKGYQSGFTSHYSTNGIYLSLGVIAAFSLWISGIGSRRIHMAIAALAFFALLLTGKRAVLAFAVIAIAVGYVLKESHKGIGWSAKLAIALAVAVFAIYVVASANPDVALVFERFAEMSDDDTLNGRTPFYELCWSMWLQSPLLGNGWDSYTIEFNKTALGASYILQGYVNMNAHNVFLQLLAEEGIVGLLLFACGVLGVLVATICMVAGKKSLFAWDLREEEKKRLLCVLSGSLIIQIYFLLYCLTGNPLYDMQVYVPYLMACGMAYCVHRRNGACQPSSKNGRIARVSYSRIRNQDGQ